MNQERLTLKAWLLNTYNNAEAQLHQASGGVLSESRAAVLKAGVDCRVCVSMVAGPGRISEYNKAQR